MRQDERARFVQGLGRARRVAFPAGEYVGQESFMSADEIRLLAERAAIGPDVTVLDVCCGIAGPGRLITSELGCRYVGVDYSASALQIARHLADGLPCRFEQARVPPLPDGPYDVVLVLETMLAFPDKAALLAEVARVLRPGGRFAFTMESGAPLTARERVRMPDADTVHLMEMDDLSVALEQAGLHIIREQSCTEAHRAAASALLEAFRADEAWIGGRIGSEALADLVAAHELWCDWLSSGRVRKYDVVAQRR